MSAPGWTSYWVTTGPALRPMIRAGMSKLASFLMMISSFSRWADSSPPGAIGIGDVVEHARLGQPVLDRSRLVGAESPAAVMSSGARSARGGRDERGRRGATGPCRSERRRGRHRARDGIRDRLLRFAAPDRGLAFGGPSGDRGARGRATCPTGSPLPCRGCRAGVRAVTAPPDRVARAACSRPSSSPSHRAMPVSGRAISAEPERKRHHEPAPR